MNLLRLFYKPEKFLGHAVHRKLGIQHVVVMILISIIYLLFSQNQVIPMDSLFSISFRFTFTLLGLAITILVYSGVLFVLGYLVSSKASYKELLISQIYIAIPVIILSSIPAILERLLNPLFINNPDMSLNFEIFIKLLVLLIYAYLLFLELKVINVVQQVSLRKAFITNIFVVGFLLFIMLDTYKIVTRNLDPEVRAAEREHSIEASKLLNELEQENVGE